MVKMFDYEQMGKRITEVRGKVSQAELGIIADLSHGAINYYENGKRKIRADTIYYICKYFNVSSDYLIGLTNYKTHDKDILSACDYTGLTEDTIKAIKEKDGMAEALNYLIKSGALEYLLKSIRQFNDSKSKE